MVNENALVAVRVTVLVLAIRQIYRSEELSDCGAMSLLMLFTQWVFAH